MRAEAIDVDNPMINNFFIPQTSASLPSGSKKIAEDKPKACDIQPSSTAFKESSIPIEGKATLTPLTINGPVSDVKIEIARI